MKKWIVAALVFAALFFAAYKLDHKHQVINLPDVPDPRADLQTAPEDFDPKPIIEPARRIAPPVVAHAPTKRPVAKIKKKVVPVPKPSPVVHMPPAPVPYPCYLVLMCV